MSRLPASPYCAVWSQYKLLLICSAAAAIVITAASSHHSNTCMHELFSHIKHFNFGKRSVLHTPWSTVSNRCGLNLCSSLTGWYGEDLLRLCDADCWSSQLHDTLTWGFISNSIKHRLIKMFELTSRSCGFEHFKTKTKIIMQELER